MLAHVLRTGLFQDRPYVYAPCADRPAKQPAGAPCRPQARLHECCTNLQDVKQIAGLPTGDFPEHLRCSDGGEVLYRCNVACVADREALPASP